MGLCAVLGRFVDCENSGARRFGLFSFFFLFLGHGILLGFLESRYHSTALYSLHFVQACCTLVSNSIDRGDCLLYGADGIGIQQTNKQDAVYKPL